MVADAIKGQAEAETYLDRLVAQAMDKGIKAEKMVMTGLPGRPSSNLPREAASVLLPSPRTDGAEWSGPSWAAWPTTCCAARRSRFSL